MAHNFGSVEKNDTCFQSEEHIGHNGFAEPAKLSRNFCSRK